MFYWTMNIRIRKKKWKSEMKSFNGLDIENWRDIYIEYMYVIRSQKIDLDSSIFNLTILNIKI